MLCTLWRSRAAPHPCMFEFFGTSAIDQVRVALFTDSIYTRLNAAGVTGDTRCIRLGGVSWLTKLPCHPTAHIDTVKAKWRCNGPKLPRAPMDHRVSSFQPKKRVMFVMLSTSLYYLYRACQDAYRRAAPSKFKVPYCSNFPSDCTLPPVLL